MSALPGTRAEARAAGSKRYFTGEPCKAGHITHRLTSNKICAACLREKWEARRAANLPAAAAYKREYRAKNLERARAVAKARRLAADATAVKRRRAATRAYYQKNRDAFKAARKQYVQENMAAVKALWHNRRALKAKASGKHTKEDVRGLFATQRGKCAMCSTSIKAKFHVDHIMPLSRGGSNDKRNLQLLCVRCNCSKAAKHPIDFAQERGFLL